MDSARTPGCGRRRRITLLRLAGAVALLGYSIGPAGANSLYLAGASRGANSDYAFVGALLPFDGVLGKGPALRLWGDYLDYSYTGGVGRVTASGWGGAVAGVYQFSGNWGWTNFAAGATFRDTHLSVFDPGNTQRGAHAYFNTQVDVGFNLNPTWRVRGYAGYVPATNGYGSQIGIDWAAWQSTRLGLNVGFQGDDNYNEVSAGVGAFFQLSPNLELDPSVGVSHSDGRTSAFGTIALALVTN